MISFVRREWFLAVSTATCIIFLLFGDVLLAEPSAPWELGLVFLWLFVAALGAALSVVRHADHLAVRLGEPYGTLILTLSVTVIEVVSISAVMMHGEQTTALVRDTLFAVTMIILNGMVGVSLLLGGWRHHEQSYNLQGANAYLGVIIPLTVLSLILPTFTQTTPGPTLSSAQETFLAIVSIGLYGAFLAIQTSRHRQYFTLGALVETHDDGADHAEAQPLPVHAILLAAYILPVVYLAEQLARPVDYLLDTVHAPAALGGVIIAVLVAAPEAVGAVQAALKNHLQRSVNIFLGSVLSTIGLTVPAMLVISHLTGRKFLMGLQNANTVLLVLTLTVSMVTFASGRTNVLQGAVHLVLFAVYVLLVFQG